MSDTAEQVKDALLDAALELAEQRSQTALVPVDEANLRHYLGRAAPQDLIGKSPIDLYAAMVRQLQLAERMQPHETLIRIYNPDSDEDGWSSTHTVVDVVSADMPFIVDSVLALLEVRGLEVHVVVHPMFEVERSESGELISIRPPDAHAFPIESFLHLEIDRLARKNQLAELEEAVHGVLRDVRSSVEDWEAMRAQAVVLAEELEMWAAEAEAGKPRFVADVGTDPAEVALLLRWMESGSFTFLGYREYDFVDDPEDPRIVSRPKTGLGTLRQAEVSIRSLGQLPPETTELARKPNVLNLTKANGISTVHRAVPLDYVGIKEIDDAGLVTGERRFIGLFTSTAYSGPVEDIPVVRARVDAVIERAHYERASHDHSRLRNTLQLYPRDELFQADVDQIEEMIHRILDLRDRRQVSLLLRPDPFGRFLSCLVFVPRDRHNTILRLKIQETLMEVYNGKSVRFSTEISDAPLARLHLVIYIDPIALADLPDRAAVEARLAQVTRTWDDFLRSTLVETHGEDRGLELLSFYGEAFETSYRSNVLAESAVHDIERLELLADDDLDIALHRPLEARREELRCKLYRSGAPITLSQFIPVLHDLGAVVTDERPYEVRTNNGVRRYIYDIGLRLTEELGAEDRSRFRDAVLAVWHGEAESDGLARLVVSAGLSSRDVTVLRAYVRYLMQLGSRYSTPYVIETLNQNPAIAGLLVQLFHASLAPTPVDGTAAPDPTKADGADAGESVSCDLEAQEAARMALVSAIDTVASLDADRILRSLMHLVTATVRTNHWQTDAAGAHRQALVLKLDPRQIPDVPKPVPAAEIFVYSPRTEGVHLRSGLVARGGLRWSDRMEDFRTEVLGLMKAQTVKNSIIVPVGAKGGFVVRQLPVGGTRDEVMAEVVACYKIFVGGLLDATDNIVDGVIVPPAGVVRHDGDDPYLVVAADKGTATFSDTANEIAESRNFWLGDAFASGGSAGYDHKVLAITARGAWISVERHFRELGLDVATTPFRAVGVGDMSGDVFGNGLLRSDKTCLIAAFDHRDIFIDPTPDPARSFAERQRLYDLPRSSWADYDPSLISAGGGVFPRSAKSVDITPEIRSSLGLDPKVERLAPDELIKGILLSPVDLLWNGGIGTYIKASSQTSAQVGDRSNDSVRVDAKALRCRVIGEGGNLGVTALGRIEFAQHGGRINTDAIDNSAGVDCSDHEVNLKILLSLAENGGDLTRKQRNELLESMADEVCAHVLEDNYAQNETLSAASAEAIGMLQVHGRLIEWLRREASLDRSVEALPTHGELERRRAAGTGLTRPELAVLLAHTKNLVTHQLMESDLPLDPAFLPLLLNYFPAPVRKKYAALVEQHPLRAELVAMIVSNDVVNRGGVSMIHRLMEETSATAADIARAHLAAWQIYELDALWQAVRQLDGQVPAATQIDLQLDITRLGERTSRWLLRNEPQPIDIGAVVTRRAGAIRAMHEHAAEGDHPKDVLDDIAQYVAAGVPEGLAGSIAALGPAFGFLDLSNVVSRTGRDFAAVATLHAALEEALELSWLREQIIALPRDDHWETMARSALRDEYFREHAELTAAVLAAAPALADEPAPVADVVTAWMRANRVAVDRCRRTFGDLQSSGAHDLAHASVAVRALSQLTRST